MTSVVEIGISSVGGDAVVDAAAGIDDGSIGGASGEGDVGEQADRISVRKRSVGINFPMSD